MTAPSTQDLVNAFTEKVTARLDQSRLDGPVRLDNTHTVVIIPLKGKGPIHAHLHGGIDQQGVDDVVGQIMAVPSLKDLVIEG
jgi:hypothetical protein